MENLIGKTVTAIGSCGMKKGQNVSGVLISIDYTWKTAIIEPTKGADIEVSIESIKVDNSFNLKISK